MNIILMQIHESNQKVKLKMRKNGKNWQLQKKNNKMPDRTWKSNPSKEIASIKIQTAWFLFQLYIN